MKIESALKYFNPKSMDMSDTSRSNSPETIKGADVMAALGLCQSKARFGMAVVLGKAGVSDEDKYTAISHLAQYAKKMAPKLVVKAAGEKLAACMMILAKLAFEEYAYSAGSLVQCQRCFGRRFVTERREVEKYPGYIGADGEVKIPPRIEIERVREICGTCRGKGVMSTRCRCNGTGQVRDLKESKRRGVPVSKKCERCSGLGLKRSPATKAYRAISALLPHLEERTWNRNWRSFFKNLVEKCVSEQEYLDMQFRKITR